MNDHHGSDLLTALVLVDGESTILEDLYSDIRGALTDVPYELVFLVNAKAHAAMTHALDLYKNDPKHVRVLGFGETIGPAAMLKAGLEAARGSLILTLPGEFDVDLSSFKLLHDAIEHGADLAVASRYTWKDGVARIQSRIFNRLLARAAGIRLGDVTSQTRLLRRELAQELPIYGEFHRYLPMLAFRAGFSVREVAMPQHARATLTRVHSPSLYLGRVLDLLSVFFLSRFTRHPLRLFGGLGALSGLLGILVLGIATLQKLVFGVPLADRPVLVLGTLLLGLGVQTFTIGLLGELVLFVQGRRMRDYRVAKIYESPSPALATATEDSGTRLELMKQER